MNMIKLYKENDIIKDYKNIYFDNEKVYNDTSNNEKCSYRILHLIGSGVYGVVYKAICIENGRVVALKITYQKNANLFKEIEIMKKLRHPNIVRLSHAFYTTVSNGVYVHMIMEYGYIDLYASLDYMQLSSSADIKENIVKQKEENYEETNGKEKHEDEEEEEEEDPSVDSPNEEKQNFYKHKLLINDLNESIRNICSCHNLSKFMKKNYFNQYQIKIYLYQLIRATLYLHSLCITHRDIKPQNILIFENNPRIMNQDNLEEANKECLVCIQNSYEHGFLMKNKQKKINSKNILEKNKEKNGIILEEKHMHDSNVKKWYVEVPETIRSKEFREPALESDKSLPKKLKLENICEDPSSYGYIKPEKEDTIFCLSSGSVNDMTKRKSFLDSVRHDSTSNEEEYECDNNVDLLNASTFKDENDKDTGREDMDLNEMGSDSMNDSTKDSMRDNVELNEIECNESKRRSSGDYRGNIIYKYIKLCDFNTSIEMKENFKYLSYICSRYYRAPELLFGSNYYTHAIDTWSIGCVMGELMLGKPLFLGECAVDQLVEIMKVLGTPNDEDFLSFQSVYKDMKFPNIKPITLNKLIHNCSKDSIDLLGKLLQFNPKKRIKLCYALLHTYFDDIRTLKAFEIFDRNDSDSDTKYSYAYNTNCFNFTKEELLHYTVEERKILIPLEVRQKKFDEVKEYINMSIESFDKLYPTKVHITS